MDETGLFYAMRPSTGLARNGGNGVKMIRLASLRARHEAWNDIRPETIANCWRDAQILSDRKNKGSTDHTPLLNGRGPLNGDCGIINAMNALKTANDELVEKGIVTSEQREDEYPLLVDVEEENLAGGAEMTDQDIVDLVIGEDLKENCEGKGGEEEGEIDLRPAERTTLQEAILALDVFLRFAMNEYSGPIHLISFEDEARRICRNLVAEQDAARIQTTMTSYFQRQ